MDSITKYHASERRELDPDTEFPGTQWNGVCPRAIDGAIFNAPIVEPETLVNNMPGYGSGVIVEGMGNDMFVYDGGMINGAMGNNMSAFDGGMIVGDTANDLSAFDGGMIGGGTGIDMPMPVFDGGLMDDGTSNNMPVFGSGMFDDNLAADVDFSMFLNEGMAFGQTGLELGGEPLAADFTADTDFLLPDFDAAAAVPAAPVPAAPGLSFSPPLFPHTTVASSFAAPPYAAAAELQIGDGAYEQGYQMGGFINPAILQQSGQSQPQLAGHGQQGTQLPVNLPFQGQQDVQSQGPLAYQGQQEYGISTSQLNVSGTGQDGWLSQTRFPTPSPDPCPCDGSTNPSASDAVGQQPAEVKRGRGRPRGAKCLQPYGSKNPNGVRGTKTRALQKIAKRAGH